MKATILNISQNGKPSVTVSFSITDNNGDLIKFDNTNFKGTACINMEFPLPLTSNANEQLKQNINDAILSRLNAESSKDSVKKIIEDSVAQLSTDLVGTDIVPTDNTTTIALSLT